MQSIDRVRDAVANYVSKRSAEQGIIDFSKIDLKYAYSQIPLDPQLQSIAILTFQEEKQQVHTDS